MTMEMSRREFLKKSTSRFPTAQEPNKANTACFSYSWYLPAGLFESLVVGRRR